MILLMDDCKIFTYTILIPHKDIPDLLQRCLDSIPQRDDIQIIVVDDNSNPNKVDFTHFPGLERDNVECYFTKEGKGAGYARNIGLEHAKGKWLLFADSDDFFLGGMLDKLDRWKDSDNDIVYFRLSSFCLETGKESNRHVASNILSEEYLSGHISMREYVRSFVGPIGKMILNKFVMDNHLTYEEVKVANDVRFAAMSALCVHRVAIADDVLYMISERSGSLTRSPKMWENMNRIRTRLLVLKSVNDYFVGEGYPELRYDHIRIWALEYSLGFNIGLRSIPLFLYTASLLPLYHLHKPIHYDNKINSIRNYSYVHLLYYYLKKYSLFHIKKIYSAFHGVK